MAIAERWSGHPPLPDDMRERLPRVVARLRRAGATLVYVFGSVARTGEADGRPGDVDLAVLGLEEDIWSVGADLEEILGTDRLDLLPLEGASVELRYEIIAHGRRLHAADPSLENEFELGVLRAYQDMAPFRRVQTEYVRRRSGTHGP